MNKKNIARIKVCEDKIEEKRLNIKKIKEEKIKLMCKLDVVSNIYEYFAIPSCTISITLIALFSGFVIYVLPLITALGAINVIINKIILGNKIEKLDDELDRLKASRQQDYLNREKIYASIFNDLYLKQLDSNDYYHQIVEASERCDLLTEATIPYKKERKHLLKVRNIIHKLFDYLLAPMSAIFLPLICAFTNMGVLSKVILMSILSLILFCSVMVDEYLTRKINSLSRIIDSIKSDRTVNYVKRDLKLAESLKYLESQCELVSDSCV